MKSKRLVILSLLLLGCMSVTGCDFPWNNNTQNADDNDSTTDEDTTPEKKEDTYYKTITDQTGNALLSALHSIINNSSVSTSYSWSRFEAADKDPNNPNNIITIYARSSLSKSAHVSGNVGWNREHTFPQSKLPSEQAINDNHIVFASDYKINEARSSYKMGVLTTGSTLTDSYGNSTTCRLGSVFDPNNVARGIVARSTMYVAAMYGCNPADNFESITTMINWHLEYTVDESDLNRNEVVYKNQKNRNPFVDHPEYACKIWGSTNSATKSACSNAGYTY